ncbi:hypothetical protein PENTCL1PPCAC_8830, partial [Pristionchus entomophagus]
NSIFAFLFRSLQIIVPSVSMTKLNIASPVYASYVEEEVAWVQLERGNGLFHIEGQSTETFTKDNLQLLDTIGHGKLNDPLTKMLRGFTVSS